MPVVTGKKKVLVGKACLYCSTGSEEKHFELRISICKFITSKKLEFQHYFVNEEEGLKYIISK